MRCFPRKLAPILLYHHMGSIGRRSRSYIEPGLFELHLSHMKRRGYGIVDLAWLVDQLAAGMELPRKTISITFDDGWYDNYMAAFPLLQKYAVPVTIFIVSGRIGLKDYVGWNEIREMRAAGIRFGGHTISHPRLTELTLEDARREIGDSKKKIEDGLGAEVPVFCYPYGFFNRAIRDIVEECGFRGACCNSPGRLWPDDDLFALKRVTMTYRMKNALAISASLSGYYVFFKELRAGNKPYIMEARSGKP